MNRQDRIEALGDKHSTTIRNIESFSRQVKPAIEGLIADVGQLKSDEEILPEEVEEEEED